MDHLNEIKAFRKGLAYQAWEAQYRSACAGDEHEFHRDLQLMRAVGTVREFITGVNVASKARQEVDKAEAKLAHFRRSHARGLAGLDKAAAKVERDVAERAAALAALEHQAADLAQNVALREAILRSRKGGAPPGGAGASTDADADASAARSDRMRAVALAGKLTGVAKAQAAEIEALQRELMRLRAKNFPFAPPPPEA